MMISEVIDGLIPSLRKQKTISGYASSSREGIQFMDLGTTLIRYRIAGEGSQILVFETDPPIVIEHYDYLVDMLGKDYKIVIFEPPGFGFSIPSMRLDYRFQSSVALAELFLEKLNIGSAVMVAPCVLGYGAISLAQKRPDLISHLVLSQVPSWNEMLKWKVTRDPKGLLSKPVLSQLLLKTLKKKRTPLWLKTALGDASLVEQFNSLAQQAYQHGATFNLASGFQKLLIGHSPLPSQVDTQTLFVWGEKDSSHCNTCKKSSLQMIPHANLVRIPNAGHFPELEAPDVFAAHLEAFVYPQSKLAV